MPRDTPTPDRKNGEDGDREDYPTPPPQRPIPWPNNPPVRNPPPED